MDLKTDLQQKIKGEVINDPQSLKLYSKDASLYQITPQLVVCPKDKADIQALIEYVSAHPGLSITARSAGTDMSGGAINDSIIMDMSKYFNRIKEVGKDFATAEPGVFYRDFEKATLKHDLLLPCYPASRELCTIGGMVSNNSAGEKTLKYGQTKDFVESLKVILANGQELTLEPLSKEKLDDKLKLKDAEGELYRQVFKVIDSNFDLIQAKKPKTSKNSTGYLLWEAWDKQTFDMSKVIVGSQGTLALVTEAKLRLIKPQKHSRMVVIFLSSLNRLGDIVNTVLQYKPESFESYDDYTVKFAMRFLPDIIKMFKKENMFSLLWKFLPEIRLTLMGGLPKLVLIAEFTGETESEAVQKAQTVYEALKPYKLHLHMTKSEDESQKYWVVRRESFNLLRKHSPHKRTAPFIDDIIVTPQVLPEFLPKLRKILNQYKLIYTIAGHIGNGNFHIIPLMDLSDPETAKIIEELGKKVYDLVFEYGGSMSAEHNDGLTRGPYLKQMYGDKMYAIFKQIKHIFDPKDILNPHKKVDATFEYTLSHIAKSSE